MSKYKIGDKVRVREEIKLSDRTVVDGMLAMKGEIVTIVSIEDNYCYKIKEDSTGFYWAEELFTNVQSIKSIDDLRFGDILTLRNDERYVFADGTIYGEDCLNDCDYDEIEDYYKDNLTREDDEHKYDIIKVEREGQVVFEREEILEVTMKEVCEKFGQEVKIVKENA